MYQQTEVDERHGQFPHPRAGSPKRRYLDVSLIIRNQSRTRSSRYPQCSLFQLLLSFHFGHVRRFAPRSALFTRQGPSKPPFSIPLRTVYFSTGTGLSFPTVDHLKQLMVAVLMINAFL